MKYLRKVMELGVSTTIISTMLLAACGGGGNLTSVGGGGTSVTLTPVKGKFQGSCAVSVMNASGVVVPNTVQAIQANGTTTITLPTGTTGPYLVSIAGTANNTCQYFNDDYANPQWLTLLPTQSLNALVASHEITAASGVAITALTEMAFQAASAVNGGNLNGITDMSAALHQGRAAAVTLVGLIGASAVASIFTPPAVIPASGATPTDDMGKALVNIANLNGANPINAVNLMSIYAASAVLTYTTSGVPASYASAVAALPPNYIGQGAVFASQVAINMPQALWNALGAAVAVSYLADITASGVRNITFGGVSPAMNYPAWATQTKGVLSNAIYTLTRSWYEFINGAWSPASSDSYVLGNAGWVDVSTLPVTMAINPDGTVKTTLQGYGTNDLLFLGDALAAGTALALFVPPSGVNANGQWALDASGIPTTANISPISGVLAGRAVRYLGGSYYSSVAARDIYELDASWGRWYWSDPVINASGVALTTLPIVGMPFCVRGSYAYYQPRIVAGTYDVFRIGSSCVPPAVGAVPYQTATATTVVVNGVTLMELSVSATALTPSSTSILSVINGKVYPGIKTPKGSAWWSGSALMFGGWNDTASQQLINVMNLPLF